MARYVVREGTERGKGRYMGPSADDADWQESRDQADVLSEYRRQMYAKEYAEMYGGRIVKLVPKRRPVRVTREQVGAITAKFFGHGWESFNNKVSWLRDMHDALTSVGIEVDE